MTITIYNDVILPESVIESGIRGKQIRNNTRTQTISGVQKINVNWTRTQRQYEIGFIPMPLSTWQTIEGLHEVTDGGAYGFLMQDPKDKTVAASEGLLYPFVTILTGTAGLGYGVPTYKMFKKYTSIGSSRTKNRQITRPKATPTIKRDAATVTLGASPGNAAINYDTGTVTFVADSYSSVTDVTVGATTDVTLTNELSGLPVGGRLYLTDLDGTDAATLNNQSHVITAITPNGSPLTGYVYTLSTDTTAMTISAGSGVGYKYPQASEALTFSGDFYVPVHFLDDVIDWDLVIPGDDAARMLAGPNVVLMEILE